MYPVYTSLSGNKSDRYMEREYMINVNKIEKGLARFWFFFQNRDKHIVQDLNSIVSFIFKQKYVNYQFKHSKYITNYSKVFFYKPYLHESYTQSICREKHC